MAAIPAGGCGMSERRMYDAFCRRERPMKSISIGILAHVDAGKTTCIESMLYLSHTIRKQGRVDHQDAYLDFDAQERERGITIYSKQAGLTWKDQAIDVIDTPGHVDFSSEMERSLSVLDAAVLLISGLDGVQSHTKTIWKCLQQHNIPTLIFVNKMDISHQSPQELLASIQSQLTSQAVDVQADDFEEQVALADEGLLDQYLETGRLPEGILPELFLKRQYFPVIFGSALKNEGVDQLLDQLTQLIPPHDWPQEFGARVFKITTDAQNNRLTHLRITGGSLANKQVLDTGEKVDQLRIYSGSSFQPVSSAEAGRICTVKGLEKTYAGQGLGFEQDLPEPTLEPCLRYELLVPAEIDPIQMMGYCRILTMEDPTLDIQYDEASQSISIKLMGVIQMEVLQKRMQELAGVSVGFGPGKIVYRETIAEPVFGYGHFEPLRHYAEVHLLLEPLERGSGLVFSSRVSRDVLSLNWQRLVITHLQEKEHKGVLTGSPITDMKVTLVAGRAHNKHTEGGDFRQATYRALRQGLKKASSILLEPYYAFTLNVDSASLSRALFDLESRGASVQAEPDGEEMRVSGRGPVRTLMNYQNEVNAYTRGKGQFTCRFDGYDVCENAESIIDEIGYDSELDRSSPTGSVFCSHGSGTYIPWNEVEEYLHIPIETERSSSVVYNSGKVSEEELRSIFQAAGGRNVNEKKKAASAVQKERKKAKGRVDLDMEEREVVPVVRLPECLIVDGYNMIYSWQDLKNLAGSNLFAAREELISRLVNYQGYRGISLIIVFDGYRKNVQGESSVNRGSAKIVYTRNGQSADSYIEKKVHDLRGKFRCTVATSDALIQNSALSSGASRISAREMEILCSQVNQNAFSHLKP